MYGGGKTRDISRAAGICLSVFLLMICCLSAFAYDWVPVYNGNGALNPDIGNDEIIGWKNMYFLSCINSADIDYYYNGSTYTSDSDTVTFSWNLGGLGTPGNPTGSYTGVMNIVTPGVFTVKCYVDDTKTIAQGDTGSRSDVSNLELTKQVAVVRPNIDTGLTDDGTSTDAENTSPGRIIGSNEDDDNANGVPDKSDTGTVTGENDLINIPISYSPVDSFLNGCKVRLQGTGPIKVYSDSQKTNQVNILNAPMMGLSPTTWVIGTDTMPSNFYVEGTGSGEATLELVFLRMNQSTEVEVKRDSVKFTVLAPNLAADSDNNGTIDGYDDAGEVGNPGKILGLNDDDDNSNGTLDMNESSVTGENDLKQVNLSYSGPSGFNFNGYKVQLGIESGSQNIRVWTTAGKAAEITGFPKTYTVGTDTIPSTIWIEGKDTGTAYLYLALGKTDGTEISRDQLKFVVIKTDLLTDSNNDGTVSAATDDPVQNSSSSPGKCIGYNDDDDNSNQIADRDDTAMVTGENDFGSASLSLIPTSGVNLNGCKIVIEGGSSMRVYDGGMRLVLPKTYVIGTDTLPSTLQVEGYTTGSSTLDAVFKSASNVEFYRDKVKISVIKADVDVDSNNDGSINDTDDPIEYYGSGQYIPFNDDDDNNNGTRDYLDTSAVAMENDLREVKLSNVGIYGTPPPMPAPLLTSGYKLVLSGSSNIKVWTSPQKAAEIVLPKTYTTGTDTIPTSVYVEGTGTGPAELVYTYKTTNDTVVHTDKAVMTVESMLREVQFITPSSATGGIIPVTVQVKSRYTYLNQLKLFEREKNTDPVHVTDWSDQGAFTLVSSSVADRITTAIYKLNWNSVGNVMMNQEGLHNGIHDLKAQATFAGNFVEEALTTKSTNNLVITSCNPESVVCWKGVEGTTVPIQVNLTDNDLTDAVTLTIKIYATNANNNGVAWNPVRTIPDIQVTGSQYTFNWDGKNDSGVYVEPWTYTFEVKASQTDVNNDDSTLTASDAASYRSKYLSIVRATDEYGNPIYEPEYAGYDDNGTPNDETDDNYLYYIRSYVLKDSGNIDASEGTVRLYDPDIIEIKSWNICDLPCRKHSGNPDGCDATSQGMEHDLLIKVPISKISKAGHYILCVSMTENMASRSRNHTPREALDLNAAFGTTGVSVCVGTNGVVGVMRNVFALLHMQPIYSPYFSTNRIVQGWGRNVDPVGGENNYAVGVFRSTPNPLVRQVPGIFNSLRWADRSYYSSSGHWYYTRTSGPIWMIRSHGNPYAVEVTTSRRIQGGRRVGDPANTRYIEDMYNGELYGLQLAVLCACRTGEIPTNLPDWYTTLVYQIFQKSSATFPPIVVTMNQVVSGGTMDRWIELFTARIVAKSYSVGYINITIDFVKEAAQYALSETNHWLHFGQANNQLADADGDHEYVRIFYWDNQQQRIMWHDVSF